MNDKKAVNPGDKITVIEEALLKNISGGVASDKGELSDRLMRMVECTGKGAE